MPKLPQIRASQVISALESLGFVQVRQRGSHVILKKQFIEERCVRQSGFLLLTN